MRFKMIVANMMLSALWSSATLAAPPSTTRFDGTWNVILACPKSPDGALPFTFRFIAGIKNAVLHGENGTAGQPGWMTLDGTIQSDGSAALDAHGLTGMTPYNANQVIRGVPYRHDVTAKFSDNRGTGSWPTPRVCDFTFTRQ